MSDAIALDDGYVTLTINGGRDTYYLLYTGGNKRFCVIDSYTMTGGPMEPFETLQMTIPRKKLVELDPQVFRKADAIEVGRARVSVVYCGRCKNMVVTKCKVSRDTVQIVAYHECEVLRGLESSYIISADVPLESSSESYSGLIVEILKQMDSTLHTKYATSSHMVVHADLDRAPPGTMSIGKGENLWTAMQLLCLTIGCRVFFMDDKVYIVDYSLPFLNETTYTTFDDIKDLELYPKNSGRLYNRVIGTPDYGQEGLDTVVNVQPVVCAGITVTDGNTEIGISSVTAQSPQSIAAYGIRQGQAMTMKNIPIAYAMAISDNYIEYISEAQQSVTFTVSESGVDTSVGGLVWSPEFDILTRVGRITNNQDELTVSNEDVLGNVKPQLLALSQYTRNYPECTSTYSFGVMGNITLAQNTSQILQSIGGLINL